MEEGDRRGGQSNSMRQELNSPFLTLIMKEGAGSKECR